jgi:steroid 5-alpha reductase family enzyme
LVASTSYFLQVEKNMLTTLLLALVALWGLRLFVRIFLRNLQKEEDYRYKKWRDEWGAWFYVRSYFQVYLLQGFLMIVVGYPVLHASIYGDDATFGILSFAGLIVWSIGYLFEVVGDWQLDRFITSKPPAGTILSTGLWHYTRHPNYFGEVTMWWGIWIMLAGTSMSFIALVSPLMITYLILKVSGIPMLEKRFAGNPQFEAYKRKTNAFFPGIPKQ